MDKDKLINIVSEIRNTKPVENLVEILGENLGGLIYKLLNEIDEL